MLSIKRFFLEIAAPALIVSWMAYIVFGAVAGASGFRVLNALEKEAVFKTGELANLTGQRHALEKRADMLNPASLDPDMVDESIRSVLGYVHEDDIVLPRHELDRLLENNRD